MMWTEVSWSGNMRWGRTQDCLERSISSPRYGRFVVASKVAVRSEFLEKLRIEEAKPGGFGGEWMGSGPELEVITPIDSWRITTMSQVTEEEYDRLINGASRPDRL
jgi:hypothetical protein